MKRFYAYTVTFILIWAMWYFMCPNYLRMLEGFDFFTTLPDFTDLNLEIPKPILMYISSFLLQFYSFPLAGAAINALIILLQVIFIDVVVRKIFKDAKGLWWMALLIIPFSTSLLTPELTLVRSLICLAITASAAGVVSLAMIGRAPFIPLPGIFRNLWTGLAAAVLLLGISAYDINEKLRANGTEEIARMDYLVENKKWDEILECVSPNIARQNEYMRKCALLALIEKGELAEKAFRYGLCSSNDFNFHKPETSVLRNFNMRFYSCMGMFNPAIYLAYQQASLFLLGMSFDAARSLADTYIEAEDYTLAKKYVEILSHTSCHRKWVKERQEKLEAIKDSEPKYVKDPVDFIIGNTMQDVSCMMERQPEDKRYRDIILCGMLADRHGQAFHEAYCDLVAPEYTDGGKIPSVYQEALIMLLYQTNPEELSRLNIEEDKIADFKDFAKLIGSKQEGTAKRKYYGTYWEFLYFRR